MRAIKDMRIENDANKMVKAMEASGGFTAKKLGVAVDILEKMEREECTKFLSFPACVVATGLRGIIKELVRKKRFDVLLTTCGTLDHDLARLWRNYYHGTFLADDRELHKRGINRLGNVFVPNESYGIILEKKMQRILNKIEERQYSTKELIWLFGEAISKEKRAKDSIVYWAWKNKIPIFVPGITDGAFGSQLWMYWQDHKRFGIDLFRDEQDLSDIVFEAKKTGALMIGGGISKHHVIWWNQFRGGLDYAVGITTAPEWDGSLSGARVREAISWGKVKENAKQVTVEGDATVLLPIMIGALEERLR
ncbi:MAG: deoxyhypusine synthase [Candidatus Diapherotrites archaeon]|nr:deoxyhypusine synthase [Candidatus Diapherotrites archaeon]